MARPHKQGLSYFPHDTDAANDGKLHALMAVHGAEGYAFYFILLENIFRTENGRITCGKLCEKAGWAKAIGISVEKFNMILETSLEVGCFDLSIYESEKVLTSNGIQERIKSVINMRHKDRNRKDLNKFKSYKPKPKPKDKEVLSKDNTNTKGKKAEENPRKTPVFHEENDLFVDFYSKYPKKKGKKEAQKVWNKLNPDANLVKKIMESLEVAKKTDQWQRDNGQYIPMPATWLNGARWEDQHTIDLPISDIESLDDGNWYLDSYGIKKMKGT